MTRDQLEVLAKKIVGRNIRVKRGSGAYTNGTTINALDTDKLWPKLPQPVKDMIEQTVTAHESSHILRFDEIAAKLRRKSLSAADFYKLFADPESPDKQSIKFVRYLTNMVEDYRVDAIAGSHVGADTVDMVNKFFVWRRQGGTRRSLPELEAEVPSGQCAAFVEAVFQWRCYGQLVESFYSPELEEASRQAHEAGDAYGAGNIDLPEALKRVLECLSKYCPPSWALPEKYEPPQGEGSNAPGDPANAPPSGTSGRGKPSSKSQGEPSGNQSSNSGQSAPGKDDQDSEPEDEDTGSEADGEPEDKDTGSDADGKPEDEDAGSEADGEPEDKDAGSEANGELEDKDAGSEADGEPEDKDAGSEADGKPENENQSSESDEQPGESEHGDQAQDSSQDSSEPNHENDEPEDDDTEDMDEKKERLKKLKRLLEEVNSEADGEDPERHTGKNGPTSGMCAGSSVFSAERLNIVFKQGRELIKKLAEELDFANKQQGSQNWDAERLARALSAREIHKIPTARYERPVRPEKIVLLADISGSCENFAEMFLSIGAGAIGDGVGVYVGANGAVVPEPLDQPRKPLKNWQVANLWVKSQLKNVGSPTWSFAQFVQHTEPAVVIIFGDFDGQRQYESVVLDKVKNRDIRFYWFSTQDHRAGEVPVGWKADNYFQIGNPDDFIAALRKIKR